MKFIDDPEFFIRNFLARKDLPFKERMQLGEFYREDMDRYHHPGTMEFEAHQILEPFLANRMGLRKEPLPAHLLLKQDLQDVYQHPGIQSLVRLLTP